MIFLTRPIFPAIISSLLEERWRALAFAGFAIGQVGLVALGLPAVPCPSRLITHIPCPGCGLSTSLSLLAKGKWQESFAMHPFAPLFIVAFIMVVMVSVLPASLHPKAVKLITRIETQTGVFFIVLVAMAVYWAGKLLTQV